MASGEGRGGDWARMTSIAMGIIVVGIGGLRDGAATRAEGAAAGGAAAGDVPFVPWADTFRIPNRRREKIRNFRLGTDLYKTT